LQWKVVARNGKLFFNARDVTEQKSIDVTVRRLNDELHSYVQQLQMTNKELESFSYSVSHDLRAPLRALSGYSAIMQKDYGSRLDDEARRLLNNIQLNAQRMGDLIDDLLEFSRLGRKEIQRSKVDMNKIVHTAIDEVSKAMPHKAHFQLEELPAADADQGLIQQVWVNLISNAVKYSSKKEHPEVRIGARETDERVEYFVRDNGAGFDMHFADKLFGVFQRLHRASEFDGTGVGLAIVQRIIVKHGGSIWATAEKGQGAEFCFYLAKKNSN
jgi:light-regulated signal transduction histidine kinase (bacteriophytochrome)